MPTPWLAIVGIGDDYLLSLTAYALLKTTHIILGDARHLGQLIDVIPKQVRCFQWISLTETLMKVEAYRGQRFVVLASGDPMLYGIGSTFSHYFPTAEMIMVPQVSAFSLAASRLCWPLQEVETLTLHGRPLENLLWYLSHGARLLILSEDGSTPARVAELLVAYGFGLSQITSLENMSGTMEQLTCCPANQWYDRRVSDLNVLAIECITELSQQRFSRVPGLPEEVYLHDGQITKREVRAVTLSTLSPHPGELLWDIGAGSGSVAIEWLRSCQTTRAVAVEQDVARASNIADNAVQLQVPHLQIVQASAPACLPYLPGPPEVIFIGGGVLTPGLLEACWKALPVCGRIVANAITIEAELCLADWRSKFGGTLTRLAVTRLYPVGHFTGWRSLVPITQYYGQK